MKKIIAAVLITIYLFNIGGELMLRQYFVYLSDKFFNEQTEKGKYNIGDLTEVKLPVNMPGIAEWASYENISGQIQFNDVSYNYVKMKITRHALYLLCVPNYSTTHLANQNIISANQAKHAPLPKKNHVPYSKIMVLSKFSFAFLQFRFNAPFKAIAQAPAGSVQQVSHHSPDIPEQPPRQVC